ncbi:hypothetical protein ACFQ4J_06615 [Laceyella tengchongensis]|jgi:hypothetical protein
MKLALEFLETAKQLRNTQVLFNYRLADTLAEEQGQQLELLNLHAHIYQWEVQFARLLRELADRIEDYTYDAKLDHVLCPKVQKELASLSSDECLEIGGCLDVEIECQVSQDGEYFIYLPLKDCIYERRLLINSYDRNFLNLFLQALTNEHFEI